MICNGDYYDVNGNTADGCEQAGTGGYHSYSNGYYLGELGCNDGDTGGFDGVIHSDKRNHTPAVDAFNSASGAAPQWWRVQAVGGTCANDPDITLNVYSGTANCYKLTFKSSKGTWSATTAPYTARITLGSGSYNDGEQVYFGVEKTCVTTTGESAAYSVRFHL